MMKFYEKIGDKPRALVNEHELIEFGNSIISWLMEEDAGNPSDNIDYEYFCKKQNMFDEDVNYFINKSAAFFSLMKKAEEIKRVKIKNFAAAGMINPTIAKKLLGERSKIIREQEAPAEKPAGLRGKRLEFCHQYVIDLNGTQAAIRAGYGVKNAKAEACRQLTKVDVRQYIAALQEKMAIKNEVTKDMVVSEMAKMAFSNIQNYISAGNEVKDIANLSSDIAAPVKKIKTITRQIIVDGNHVGNEVRTEFELNDKQRALDSISKLLGFDEPVKTTSDTTLSIEVSDVETRAALSALADTMKSKAIDNSDS